AFSIGEYQDIFLEEADEQLQELNQNLLEIEQNPDHIETINNIFRTAHSLKSSAAFVGLNDMSDLAHRMENLLQGIRDRTMSVTPEIIDVLFQCFDVINSIIESVAAGEEPTQDLSGIMKKIQDISEQPTGKSQRKEEISPEKSKDNNIHEPGKQSLPKKLKGPKIKYTQKEKQIIKNGLQNGMSCCEVDIYIEPSAPMRWIKVQLIINNLEQISEIVKVRPATEELNSEWDDDNFRVVILTSEPLEEIKKACEVDLVMRVDMKQIGLSGKKDQNDSKLQMHEKTPENMKHDEKEGKTEQYEVDDNLDPNIKDYKDTEVDDEHEHIIKKDDKKATSLKIVKVSVDKLDLLLNNVGELVIANSGFYQLFEDIKNSDIDSSIINNFKNRIDQMSRIAKDLQNGIMKTRMVPIGQVFSRFNRLVRDLAKEFNKNIKLVVKGEDTELDKKVVDAIGEPLMHLIRNSVDHGIETSEERKKLDKSEEAIITLNAYQGGNHILIEVSDDGRGLNIEKIKKKALENELTTPELLINMDIDEI
ncbi:MAG: Hpt domain-containing protein, partial [Thermodesulfobacteriota bacterium]|nr:Hpt domain-containing protein [Thermodesulfobacteriota bacterium]